MRNEEINEEEKGLLRRYNKASPVTLIRLKCQAVLIRSKGVTLKDIGDIVERSERTVSAWIQDWEARRMASIFSGHADNENASKLTQKQKEEIREVLQRPPNIYGIPKEFWDVPTLKQYVDATFGIVYESAQSYHFLLRFSHLSFKYPDTFDRRRNDIQIVERMQEIHKEIEPFLKDPSWEVFAADEVRMELEALTRRAWLKCGERTIVKVNRKREAQSYIGFLNQKTFRCHLYELGWQNQEEILKTLPRFLEEHPDKKICIIWDNAGFHKGQEIRKALRKGGLLERIHLINMPPYAPDHNPIEHVWNAAKTASANVQSESFETMKTAFAGYVTGRTFEYQI
jgi:transposase